MFFTTDEHYIWSAKTLRASNITSDKHYSVLSQHRAPSYLVHTEWLGRVLSHGCMPKNQ